MSDRDIASLYCRKTILAKFVGERVLLDHFDEARSTALATVSAQSMTRLESSLALSAFAFIRG
jgi:hypothetical protein